MQSSAKSVIVLLLMQSGNSLIHKRNKRGPRTVPCGTPEDTGIEKEQVPLRTTCVCSVRIDLSIGVFFLGCHTIEVCKAACDVGRCCGGLCKVKRY